MDDARYRPEAIEPKWQERWADADLFTVRLEPGEKKYYLLEMLPYPSGRIHMGHVRNYTIGDVAARYRMMKGEKVLHPMGWDAFGMPAENAAIKHNLHPAKWTHDNIDYMRGQLQRLGLSYDWGREFATCDPDYYRWEQLVFVRMFEKGQAYKKESPVNWCPTCHTVLANEQAEGGQCWRCDSQVETRLMAQWYLRITDYAEELLRDIDDKLGGWPERVRTMQREWIGKSHGAHIDFAVEGSDEPICVFTTRPDTLFGATFMSLACTHPRVRELAKGTGQEEAVERFIAKSATIDHQAWLEGAYEKDGVFTGAYCTNPVTGWRMPIYAANFVLMEYGTGAVMAVPAHDQRDFEFAKKYRLDITVVIQPEGEMLDPATMEGAWEGAGTLVDSQEFTGMPNAEAIDAIAKALEQKGIGGSTITYRLKDWCISRQRYWGAPIPIVHCDACGAVPVPEEQLPVVLPHDVPLTGEGGSPLAQVAAFVETSCPACGKSARRETDTMDTFMESSWYMFRYTSPHCSEGPVERAAADFWMPVDQYIGGIEHAVGHLIYCRYYTKVLRDLGFVGVDEPVRNLMTQGMVYKDGAKMSKSKGNVVDPDEMIERYGADTVRLFSLFAAPPEKDLEWNDQGIEGAGRFLQRVWRFVAGWIESNDESRTTNDEMERWRHRTVKRVTEDIERYHFNTAIAAIMEYVNFLYGQGSEATSRGAIETLVHLIAPFAPHAAEELWERLGHDASLLTAGWPVWEEGKIAEETVTIVVQVNGKLRDRVAVPAGASKEEQEEAARASAKVAEQLKGREPKKVIVVPGKLVNIVV